VRIALLPIILITMIEPEPIGFQLVVVTLVFGILALTILSVRLWSRVDRRKQDASDLCLVLAIVSNTRIVISRGQKDLI